MSIFVLFGFAFLTLLILKMDTKADMLSLVASIIFAVHQMHLFIKVDPLGNVNMQAVFRYESHFQFLAYIMMLGPFLPLRYYFPPMCLIYSVSFWAIYF